MSGDLFRSAKVPAPRVGALQSAGAAEAQRKDAHHLCRVCGRFGAYGFGGSERQGRTYRWACADHRDAVERMTG